MFCQASWICSRWMVLFCLICTVSYLHAVRSRNETLSELNLRFCELEKMKKEELEVQQELQRRLQSEGDPSWIEISLIRELGVVPDGWIKVQFRDYETKK